MRTPLARKASSGSLALTPHCSSAENHFDENEGDPFRSLFPLPLSPFEHYMLADDRPHYPMVFYFRLRFAGTIEAAHFESALNAALVHHPLLRANIVGPAEGRTAQLRWVAAVPKKPGVGIASTRDEDSVIDLRRDIGTRVRLRQSDHRTEALFQFHHCCCDAIGAVHFLETFLTALAAGPGQCANVPWSSERGAEQIRSRVRLAISWTDQLRRMPRDLARIRKFFATSPVPLAGSQTARDLPSAGAGLVSHIFDEEESQRILRTAKSRRATMNDLLLRELFVALAEWNRCRGRSGPLRIAMPINMRPNRDQRGPAVNTVSMVFLDRRPRDIADPEELLSSVQMETREVKRWGLGRVMWRACSLLGAVPKGILLAVSQRRCANSAVLSNLGVVLPGAWENQLALESVEFFPPIRPLTRAAFGVLSYRGKLVLSLRYDVSAFSAQESQELLETVVDQMRLGAGLLPG